MTRKNKISEKGQADVLKQTAETDASPPPRFQADPAAGPSGPEPATAPEAAVPETAVPETADPEPTPSTDQSAEAAADMLQSFPIVGIGASAGGLAAFEAFFTGMPAGTEPGMAFVLVQHLAPDHKSILTDIIRRYTRMQVFEVEDGMRVHANCAYIIPPNRDMAFLNGTLQLLDPIAPRGHRLPIDFFFRSLAQDQRERAIGIVLSGTGSDGTLGVRDIKGEGGMVMAQNPASTEYDGMPRSALATGLVDFELPPAEMPAQLITYAAHAFGRPPRPAAPAPKAETALKKIFVLLRIQTGHDFSQYKPSTILRRIERRMAVHQIETMEEYVRFAQQAPEEVEALFRDLLIGVTSFFRDPEAFKALEEQVVPRLFAGRSANAVIRIWSVGCSTGEEAYSLAILLAEHQAAIRQSFQVQVFATDIDSQAIATARAGIYPASIATDVSPERLARFFTAEPDNSAFRIHKTIRDMLVFSEQNVIKDPPFSRLDLISCRNLLIYMSAGLQKKVIPLFHYALNPGGVLFLGTSETVGEFLDLFAALERKQKLYQRKDDLSGVQRKGLVRFVPSMTAIDGDFPQVPERTAPARRLPVRELTEQALLQQVVQAGALVNAQGDILYLHGRTGMYLEPAPGESGTLNILKMAREGLRRDLTTALHKVAQTGETVRRPGLRVKTNGDFITVNLIVRPVAVAPSATPEPSLYLVILEQAQAGGQGSEVRGQGSEDGSRLSEAGDAMDADARIAALKQELLAKDEYLQSANEELETSNEELKCSNEEMQSVNEELQSTNEELETSKEELHSVNEELATVNAELQTKVADLSRANNDMNNLLAGTGIATVFVDLHLRILNFTPAVTRIINLILSDIGRPVGHIVSNLPGYDTLMADIQAVLDTLIPREADVQTAEGRWYAMRILPYRTMDNVIEGAVLTFVDVTETRKMQENLRMSVKMLNASQRLSMTGGWEWNVATQTMYWTEETYRIHDFAPGEMEPGSAEHINRSRECYEPEDRPVILAAFQRCVEEGQPYDFEFLFTTAKGRRLWIRTTAHPLVEQGKVIKVIGNIIDITERRHAEEVIKNINQQLQKANDEKDKLFAIIAHDLKSPMCGLVASTEMLANQADIFSENDIRLLSTELHKGAKNTYALLEDLLQWARMSQGGIGYAPTPCSTKELVNMSLYSAQIDSKRKDIDIRSDIPQGLTVLVDQPMINTVIRNILFNAIKFTRRGGEIVITAQQEGQSVTMAIQDNGIGMDEQTGANIFSIQGKTRHLGTEGEKGTGLGLVLCKQFIEQHGGQIWVESEPGKGTTVFFTLPTQETRTPQTAEPLNR